MRLTSRLLRLSKDLATACEPTAILNNLPRTMHLYRRSCIELSAWLLLTHCPPSRGAWWNAARTMSTRSVAPSSDNSRSMAKRKRAASKKKDTDGDDAPPRRDGSVVSTNKSPYFRETSAAEALNLTDGVRLAAFGLGNKNNEKSNVLDARPPPIVIMPWLGFGTYRLGKEQVKRAVAQALECGYRAIDSAFIYGGETTEKLVGEALRDALERGVIHSRNEVFVTTKHWRKYHGYEPTLQCLNLSLKRLQLDFVDLYLMHWPGPAWTTMHRKKEVVETNPWHYAVTESTEMVSVRAETWRAMEDAVKKGLCRAIGVSNMKVDHLEELKKTATLWPPAVNQVEFHPLFPQTELVEYCRKEGIVLQAYASLGGQDTGKKAWSKLLGKKGYPATDESGKKLKAKDLQPSLLKCEAVVQLARTLTDEHRCEVTPAQLLLRWGLEKGAALIPKTTSMDRLQENAGVFDISMSPQQVDGLEAELLSTVRNNNPECPAGDVESLTRLCWRSDPLRLLDFD